MVGAFPTILGGTFEGGVGGRGGAALGCSRGLNGTNGLPFAHVDPTGKNTMVNDHVSQTPYSESIQVSSPIFMGGTVSLALRPKNLDFAKIIASVTVDLTDLGLEADTPLVDDATNGDETACDGIYSLLFNIPANLAEGDYYAKVVITDNEGAQGTPVVQLKVSNYPLLESFFPTIINSGQTTVFTAEAEKGLATIQSVTIDLSSLEGDNAAAMLDDGQNGDLCADDGIYSLEFLTPGSIEPGVKSFQVIVKPTQGDSIYLNQNLLVIPAGVIALEDFEKDEFPPLPWPGPDCMVQSEEALIGSQAVFLHNWNTLDCYAPLAEVSVNLPSSGTIGFWTKIISYDGFFNFYIDNVLAYQHEALNEGNLDWQQIGLPIEPGLHTLSWVLENGWSAQWSNGVKAWIDAITFTPQSFMITAQAEENGNIVPSGVVTVSSGRDQTFSISAEPGYKIHEVKVDGLSQGVVNSYTFNEVSSNHTIEATFIIDGPDISVEPASFSFDFNEVTVGHSSPAQSFILTNIGTKDLVIETISMVGQDVSEFFLQNDSCAGQAIAPENTCTFEVVFTPLSEGEKNTNLAIASNDQDEDMKMITLSGHGLCTEESLPTASFSASTTNGCTPLEVQFTNTSTSTTALGYTWDFGDRESSQEENPSHTYGTSGIYTVILKATNACGESLSQETHIEVIDPAEEICDNLDNNCDGVIDENLSRDCSTDCGPGTETCQAGQWVNCTAPPVEPENCLDDLDNNCDGSINEGCVYQTVTISPETVKSAPCDHFSLTVNYNVTDGNNKSSGLGIHIHYDSTKLSYVDHSDFLDVGEIKVTPCSMDDINDEDGDPDTDKMIQMSWASFAGQWPNVNLPTILAKLNFTMNCDLQPGQETLINISSFENDANYNFVGIGSKVITTSCSFDIDDNGEVKALTDGLLIMRYLFRYPEAYGDNWISGVTANNCERCTAQDISNYLESIADNLCLDVDDNGEVKALTDGLLIMRYLFRYPEAYGDNWISGVVANNGLRATAEDIENYLSSLIIN